MFLLLLLNCALYAADHLGGLPVSKLYLNHWSPRWYQFLTSAFCHASWQHLSGNAFLLLIFGRNVEEEVSSSASLPKASMGWLSKHDGQLWHLRTSPL